MGGGAAAAGYSWDNREESDWGKFFAGWGATFGINAGIGFVTGAFGAVIAAEGGLASQASRFISSNSSASEQTLSILTGSPSKWNPDRLRKAVELSLKAPTNFGTSIGQNAINNVYKGKDGLDGWGPPDGRVWIGFCCFSWRDPVGWDF